MSERQNDANAQELQLHLEKLQESIESIKKIIIGLEQERTSSPEAAGIIDLQIANYKQANELSEKELEELKKNLSK